MNNNEINNLIKNLIDSFNPSKTEEAQLNQVACSIKNKIESYVSTNKMRYYFVNDVILGGSFAKGTWLKHETDIDIFIKLNVQTTMEDFEKLGTEIGLQSLKEFNPYVRYADHPYVEAYAGEVKVNVVPCFDVSYGKWKSAADRSPFHTRYITRYLDNDKKNHVRLLKKFLKANNIYGAEISTQGFSGYVCEVLILKFGSFLSVLEYFSNFTLENNIIVVSENDVLDKEQLGKKFNSFLILLDPVDSNRNLGAAISSHSVAKFIMTCRKFLKNPEPKYLACQVTPLDHSMTEFFSPYILIIEFKFSSRPPDIIWGQLKKSANSISKFVNSYGFNIIKSSCYTDEKENCVIAFLMESPTISKLHKRIGPEVLRIGDTEKFIQSNSDAPAKWISEDIRVNCILLRDFTNVKDYLEFVFKNKTNLIGIPKGLRKDFSSVKVYTLDQQKNINEHVKSTLLELLCSDTRILQ
ncbi:MAG: CCA tRNA nucleotidyltransferase [Thermoproteota archaeon]|nr:CCA tRNA nucleotidyltransferase [Thermoproteota archaeon]